MRHAISHWRNVSHAAARRGVLMNQSMNASTQRGGYNDVLERTAPGVAALANPFRLLQ